MQSLGNQNTISDLDTSDTLSLQGGMSPLHLFMFLLLAVWGFLYVNGRQNQESIDAKPSSPSGGPGSSGSGGSSSSSSGGSSSSSSGSGGSGAMGSGELF
eukprot:CAMPEP_0197664872 /NCGR_PEP_ID=MMETSP1338-20131121/58904_1 /TAXON_ID=43686 ORGANISM="Pelagodinium beii, Strain RCC1491" /NCGR_SAMPLE_ID=MMETSP1338 /ASSEMBLY_ACC=CAM_ASM_000754 /LENGTH=99 /DNA_ID=CAMNT_0043243597 /DNA_START=141 /DNA_END=440 /DNA_ORIENTATION=-